MTALSYVTDGDPAAPALFMGSSIGTTTPMWARQAPALAQRWRVIRFDARGHGTSPSPEGPYAVADLADDVVELADLLGVPGFAYCGLSMGGAIGQQLAVDHPDRVTRLVLCCTAAWFGGADPWSERARRVRSEGLDWLLEVSPGRWFRPDAPVPPGGQELLAAQKALDPAGYAWCAEALGRFDLRDRLGEIRCPTTVVAGAQDVATPLPMSELLAAGIPDAVLTVVPGAAHIAALEQPDAVLAAIDAGLIR